MRMRSKLAGERGSGGVRRGRGWEGTCFVALSLSFVSRVLVSGSMSESMPSAMHAGLIVVSLPWDTLSIGPPFDTRRSACH